MERQGEPSHTYGHAAFIAFWPLLTWALISFGLQRFVSVATDEFYANNPQVPDWAELFVKAYLFSPILILWYMPTVAALSVCVSLVHRRATALTLKTAFVGMTVVCMVLALVVQHRISFATTFCCFAVIHTVLSVGLTVWLIREIRTLLTALSKANCA